MNANSPYSPYSYGGYDAYGFPNPNPGVRHQLLHSWQVEKEKLPRLHNDNFGVTFESE